MSIASSRNAPVKLHLAFETRSESFGKSSFKDIVSGIMSLRDEIISRVSSTDAFPASALKAIRLLNNDNSNMGEIVQTIAYDPGLTSNILKLANSSSFGCARAIGSLREAIVRLGTRNIFKLIAASMSNMVMTQPIRAYGYGSGEYWEHSIAVAVSVEILCDLLHVNIPHVPFTSGLLHDIGKVITGRFIKKRLLLEFQEEIEAGNTFEEVEGILLGIDHAETGALLLENWQLPEKLVVAVRNHHNPSNIEPPDTVSEMIHICDYWCLTNEIGPQKKVENISVKENAFIGLGITDEIKTETILRTQSSMENIRDLFSK
jgi:putative nucleotidyltransferase with HDIG domain